MVRISALGILSGHLSLQLSFSPSTGAHGESERSKVCVDVGLHCPYVGRDVSVSYMCSQEEQGSR